MSITLFLARLSLSSGQFKITIAYTKLLFPLFYVFTFFEHSSIIFISFSSFFRVGATTAISSAKNKIAIINIFSDIPILVSCSSFPSPSINIANNKGLRLHPVMILSWIHWVCNYHYLVLPQWVDKAGLLDDRW